MSNSSTSSHSQDDASASTVAVFYRELRRGCEKFVGPMPISQFFSEFVPEATEKRPGEQVEFGHPSISNHEDEFIDAIKASGLCPKLRFVNTTRMRGSQCLQRPDISIYSDDHSGKSSLDRKMVDLWVENKDASDEVFFELAELKEHDQYVLSHIKWTHPTYRICSQLLAYASSLHHSQRVFSFGVILFGTEGRLLRLDRSGVIYTESFEWKKCDTLFELFWRFNFLSDLDRGYDTTVTSVGNDEAEAALSKLKTYKGLEDIQREDLHKVLVHDDHPTGDRLRWYITPSPIWRSDAFFGRATFGYIAYDIVTSNLVYIKDFWHMDGPNVRKEGDVYRELHEAHVPHIPKLGRAGDVPLSLDHASMVPFVAQRTKTQDYVKGSGLGHEWCPGRPSVYPYVHHRLVLETLGQPLNTFKSTRQLCEVIRDAIVAHTVAYEKAQILHRDVSAGNILISEDGSGILIDWELSRKVVKRVDTKSKQYSCTGTWRFMSIIRLRDGWDRPHEISDDLESFFWVLLYLVTKCRSVGWVVSGEMRNVFDQRTDLERDSDVTGGTGKISCLRDGYYLGSSTINDLVNTPCKDIIEEFRTLFRHFYCHVPPQADLSSHMRSLVEAKREQDPLVKVAHEKLSSSRWILDMINKHLASKWMVEDDGSLHKTVLRPVSFASRNPRKRKAADSGEGRQTS